MAKKNTTSTDTNPASKGMAAATGSRRRTAKKSAAETATAAAGEPVARHRKATPANYPVQPEVAAVAVPVEEVPVVAFTEHPVAVPEQTPTSSASTSIHITQDDVARLAFSYFEERGYQGGSPEADWLRAEEELMQLVG